MQAKNKSNTVEDAFKALSDLIADPLVIIDTGTIVQAANKAVKQVTGYSQEELVGKSFLQLEFLDGENKAILAKNFEKRMNGVDIEPYDVKFTARNGQARYVEVRGKAIEYFGKQVNLVVLHDVTQRNRVQTLLETNLSVNEEKLRSIFDSAPDPIAVSDLKGKVIDCNPAALNTFGYSEKKEIIDKSVFEFFAEKDRAKAMETLTREQGKVKNVEYTFLAKGGREFQAELSASPMYTKSGKITSFVSTIRDITERKKAEEQIGRAAEEWKKTFDAISDSVFVLDKEHRFTNANKALCDLLRKEPKELIGKRCYEVMHGADEPVLDCPCAKAKVTRKPEEIEIVDAHSGLWFLLSVWPFFDENGEYAGCVHTAKDITERKKAEETLRASEEKYRVISSITADLVFSCIRSDERGFTVDWMAGAAEKIFGYSTKEINKKGCWKFTVQPQDLPIFDEKVTGLKPGQSSICELRITHKDGSLKWIKVLARVVIDSSNPTNYRLFGACRDITERKKAEEKLKKLKAFDERIIDSLGEALLIIDPDDYRIINVNKEALEQLNLRRDDLIGKTCYEATHHRSTPCQAPEHICPIRKMLETGEPVTVEHTHFDHQNNEVDVEVSAYPVTDSEGKTVVIHVAKNITEHKLMGQAVRDSEEKFRTISSAVKDALILVDGDGSCLLESLG